MKKFIQRSRVYLPFILCFILLSYQQDWRLFLGWNTTAQLLIFFSCACLPAYLTQRMSYVDIAWPWGLVAIGLLVLILGEGYWLRKSIIAGMYLFSGLRMGIGALVLWKKGHLATELPRYKFQRKRWAKMGFSNEAFSIQFEILIQAFANMSFLALPALFHFNNTASRFSALEIIGFVLYLLFVSLEHIADLQKQKFLRQARLQHKKRPVCRLGLWQYSRHPNYFSEWMVWNAMLLTTVPVLLVEYSSLKPSFWLLLGFALLYTSKLMYDTLVYYTGVIPSEYYSLQKRPDYREYQQKTAMFFPSFPKK